MLDRLDTKPSATIDPWHIRRSPLHQPRIRQSQGTGNRKQTLLFPVLCSLFPVPCSLFPVPCPFGDRRPGGHSEGRTTRSHPELGREIPQRPWYCVLRRGRVGRRQAFNPRRTNTHNTTHDTTHGQTLSTIAMRRIQRPPRAGHAGTAQYAIDAGWSSPVARQAHNCYGGSGERSET